MNATSKRAVTFLGAILWASMALHSPSTAQTTRGADVAVVVNSEAPVTDRSLSGVRKVLLGERQYWNSKLPVVLQVSRAANAALHAMILMGQLHAPDDFLESRVSPEAFKHRLDGQGNQAAVVFFVGLFQPFEGFLFFAHPHVRLRDAVGRDIAVLRQFRQTVEPALQNTLVARLVEVFLDGCRQFGASGQR